MWMNKIWISDFGRTIWSKSFAGRARWQLGDLWSKTRHSKLETFSSSPKIAVCFLFRTDLLFFSGDWCVPLHSMDAYGWYLFVSDQPINRSQWLTGAIRYGALESDPHIDPPSSVRFAGTPSYMAPEVFRNAKYTVTWRGHGKTMDNPQKIQWFLSSPFQTPRINMDQPRVSTKTLWIIL